MFKLETSELQNALEAIEHHGYSTMLPQPSEWKVVVENWDEIRDRLSNLDLDNYVPCKPLTTFAPKSRANVRIVHLLHPEDLIIYTALILSIKNDIEVARQSIKSKRVFSYRVDRMAANRLYDTRGSHEKYIDHLGYKSKRINTNYVGIADIADFYPRVNQHRLENIIATIATTDRGKEVARVLVGKLVSNLMGRNSYGIPVGPYASRVLGEAVLIDVDTHLSTNGIDFVRWVDDYNIFASSELKVQKILFDLGEWLYSQHGLTLQTSKTRILTDKQFMSEFSFKPDIELTDRDHVLSLLRDSADAGDYDDDCDEDPDEDEVERLLAELQTYDLEVMFNEAVSGELVDLEMVKYVLNRLPSIPDIDESLKIAILDKVIDNAELLYPVSEYIAKYIIAMPGLDRSARKKIGSRLLKPLLGSKNPPPDYYAMWILHIFSTSEDWNHVDKIAKLYTSSTSEIVKRYSALAIATCGDRAHAVVTKNDLDNSSRLVRLAILCASRKLGNDERKHWKLSNQIKDLFEKLI